MNPLRHWYPKDWRAGFALVFTVIGGGVLTWFAWHIIDLFDGYATRLITELIKAKAANDAVPGVLVTIISSMAWGLKMLLAGLIVVILSLGFAVNRRSFKLSKTGLDFEGGDGPELPPTPVKFVNEPGEEVPVAPLPPAEDEGKLPPYARSKP